MNFDETELGEKIDHVSNYKVKLFREIIVIIEEQWISGTNLTDCEIFPVALIKRAK